MGRLISLLAGLFFCLGAIAETLNVEVLDADGKPLPEAVLWISPGPAIPGNLTQQLSAQMDQQKRAFVPSVLVVQRGTTVRFPNSDPINHHVYSFSPAKRFELHLHHKGEAAQTVLFDQPGLVTLGCNVHDWMLGFIRVVDSPWFAQTDARGRASLTFQPAAGQTLELWHPRISADGSALTFVPDNGAQQRIVLEQPLRRDPRPPNPSRQPRAEDYD